MVVHLPVGDGLAGMQLARFHQEEPVQALGNISALSANLSVLPTVLSVMLIDSSSVPLLVTRSPYTVVVPESSPPKFLTCFGSSQFVPIQRSVSGHHPCLIFY